MRRDVASLVFRKHDTSRSGELSDAELRARMAMALEHENAPHAEWAHSDVGDDDALRALELREGGDVALGERGQDVRRGHDQARKYALRALEAPLAVERHRAEERLEHVGEGGEGPWACRLCRPGTARALSPEAFAAPVVRWARCRACPAGRFGRGRASRGLEEDCPRCAAGTASDVRGSGELVGSAGATAWTTSRAPSRQSHIHI